MDPLSIIASTLAVATAAAKVCSGFAELRSLCRNLPGRLHAVNNEVADLELVLFQITLLIEERQCLPESKQSAIPHLLKRAKSTIGELDTIVEELNFACRKSRSQIAGVVAWRKQQSRLQKLQEDIRDVKCHLNLILGTTNSKDMLRIRLDLDSITTITSQSTQEQRLLQDKFMNSIAGVDERIAKVEEMLRAQTKQLQANQVEQVGPMYNVCSAPRRPISPRRNNAPVKSVRSEEIGIRVSPYTVACQHNCICDCHTQQRASTPALVNRLFGQLFVGYAGVPFFAPKCNVAACQKSQSSQVHLEYWFPLGFFSSTIVRMQVGRQNNLGTTFQMETLRRVPDTAQCVNFALNGDIDGLKYLFGKGLASPRDVSTTRGYSLLRWALYGKQYRTCDFLLHAGADADYRPIAASDNSPRKKACHSLLEGSLSDTALSALQTITKGGHFDDFVDEAELNRIHKIVLGLSGRDLEEECLHYPMDVNKADAMGRTPLAWAAARGDERAVVTLLSHGADPNMIDVQLSGPLSNAAAQGHAICVRLLLEAGANPDPVIIGAEKKGSALNCAARNAMDVVLLKSLIDFGADIESAGVDGKTALHHAARTDNASFALLLLESGADINAMSTNGSTPLTTAITHNSHDVLQLVLDRWHEYSDCPRLKGPHLLQIVSTYADIKTIDILAASDHLRLKYDQHYILGDFGTRLRQRPDLTEKLIAAFDDLLSIINQSPDPRTGTESLLEGGFMSCLSSRVNSGIEEIDRGRNIDVPSVLSQMASCLSLNADDCSQESSSEHGSSEYFEDAVQELNQGND